MIIEQFVVFWLTVTFHRHDLSADKCAILGKFDQQMFSRKQTKACQKPTSDHRILPSKGLLLCDMVVKDSPDLPTIQA
jgi:hypothetical protein